MGVRARIENLAGYLTEQKWIREDAEQLAKAVNYELNGARAGSVQFEGRES